MKPSPCPYTLKNYSLKNALFLKNFRILNILEYDHSIWKSGYYYYYYYFLKRRILLSMSGSSGPWLWKTFAKQDFAEWTVKLCKAAVCGGSEPSCMISDLWSCVCYWTGPFQITDGGMACLHVHTELKDQGEKHLLQKTLHFDLQGRSVSQNTNPILPSLSLHPHGDFLPSCKRGRPYIEGEYPHHVVPISSMDRCIPEINPSGPWSQQGACSTRPGSGLKRTWPWSKLSRYLLGRGSLADVGPVSIFFYISINCSVPEYWLDIEKIWLHWGLIYCFTPLIFPLLVGLISSPADG